MLHVFDKDMSRWIMKTAHMWAKARAAKSDRPYREIFKRCLQQVHIEARMMLDQIRQLREHVISAFDNELFLTAGCGIAAQLRVFWNVLATYNPFKCELSGLNLTRWHNADNEFRRAFRDAFDDVGRAFGPFHKAMPTASEVQAKLARFVA